MKYGGLATSPIGIAKWPKTNPRFSTWNRQGYRLWKYESDRGVVKFNGVRAVCRSFHHNVHGGESG